MTNEVLLPLSAVGLRISPDEFILRKVDSVAAVYGGSCQEYLYFELDQHAHHARGERVMKGLLLCSCLSPPRLGEIVEIRLRTRFVVGVALSDIRRRD